MRKHLIRLRNLSILAIIIGLSIYAFSNITMVNRSIEKSYQDVDKVPFNDVALVLGASFKTRRGNVNPFFSSRMKAASELYLNGKVKHILVSGDNHSHDYDESTDMRNYLMDLGVKEEDITLDYAGFRTLDSVVRCKEIFGINKVTIVSQPFHNPRALFLADKVGLKAIAFDAPKVTYSKKVRAREKLARIKAFLDIYVLFTKPKFLGKEEKIVL